MPTTFLGIQAIRSKVSLSLKPLRCSRVICNRTWCFVQHHL